MFGNIQDILLVAEELAEMLRERVIEQQQESVTDIFLNMGFAFKLYSRYISQFQKASETLQELSRSNDTFRTWLIDTVSYAEACNNDPSLADKRSVSYRCAPDLGHGWLVGAAACLWWACSCRRATLTVDPCRCIQNGYLLRRGGGQNRWHSLVNCNHGDSSCSIDCGPLPMYLPQPPPRGLEPPPLGRRVGAGGAWQRPRARRLARRRRRRGRAPVGRLPAASHGRVPHDAQQRAGQASAEGATLRAPAP
jgi:hypothetical protein